MYCIRAYNKYLQIGWDSRYEEYNYNLVDKVDVFNVGDIFYEDLSLLKELLNEDLGEYLKNNKIHYEVYKINNSKEIEVYISNVIEFPINL